MARGPKKHMKRLKAPKHWMLDKLTGIFAPRPSTGPHKMRESLPLLILLLLLLLPYSLLLLLPSQLQLLLPALPTYRCRLPGRRPCIDAPPFTSQTALRLLLLLLLLLSLLLPLLLPC